MKQEIAQKMRRAKERIENRHAEVQGSSDSGLSVFSNQNIKYEIGGRQIGIAMGGIGAMHKFVKSINLDKVIDEKLHLLKIHKPYHESDHVLNFAYNALCGGKVIDDIDHRGFENIRLKDEDILEFLYRPIKCEKEYRIVAVRKNLTRLKSGKLLFEDTRFFFYITNDDSLNMFEVAKESCDRCNQENLIEQQKNGVHAFRAPLDSLNANWAWMVMSSLAWTLKAWMALSLPVKGPHYELRRKEANEVLRMEFRTFINSFMRIPAQIIKTGRRLIFRLMTWNPRLPILFRFLDTLT